MCEFSIIIPTRDAAFGLERLLQSISRQKDANCEVIVVDQESSDGTADVASSHGALLLSVVRPRFYSPPAVSRNSGARASKGRYLVHLDADMELPDPKFLAHLRPLFSDSTQAVVLHEADVATGFWSRVKAVERRCYAGTSIESARAITREVFEAVGGYDTRISSGEDYDISQRVAQHTLIARAHPLWITHHTGAVPLRALLRKKFSYGLTASAYLGQSRSRGGPSSLDLLWIDLQCYIRGWRQLLRHPVAYVGIFVIRPMEFGALVGGMAYAGVARRSRLWGKRKGRWK